MIDLIVRWVLSIGSITGACFCVFKKPITWWIWSFVDLGWMIYYFRLKEWPEFALWTAFLGVCVFGIYEWGKDKKKK